MLTPVLLNFRRLLYSKEDYDCVYAHIDTNRTFKLIEPLPFLIRDGVVFSEFRMSALLEKKVRDANIYY